MSEQNNLSPVEQAIHDDLHGYLVSVDRVDKHFPVAPDIEDLWPKIGESYLPDGTREFVSYPTVALGWIMFVGMAVARYWDDDWEVYGRVPCLYTYLRDRIDFDHMDDYICERVLMLDAQQKSSLTALAAECASRTYNLLCHQHIEPGTPEAFRSFVAALHQMYVMGAAIELKTLGYHMEKL